MVAILAMGGGIIYYAALYYVVSFILCYSGSVKGECGSGQTVVQLTESVSDYWILLNETGYCFLNECTIRIIEDNVSLNIINRTREWITASNATNSFVFGVPNSEPNSDSDITHMHCSRGKDSAEAPPEESFFIFFAVIYHYHFQFSKHSFTFGCQGITLCVWYHNYWNM